MITWFMIPEIWCKLDGQTDGQSDGKKWHIEVGAPPKNIIQRESLIQLIIAYHYVKPCCLEVFCIYAGTNIN